MKTRNSHLKTGCGLAAAALAALLGLTGPAIAQTTVGSNLERSKGPTPEVARAQVLEARAEALRLEMTKPGATLQMARLYREAADLRADDDSLRAEDYHRAAIMYQHAGRVDGALKNEVLAAEFSLMNGRVVEAAHRFINAAILAQAKGDYQEEVRLAHRAEMLCNCPMMAPSTAGAIHQRIANSGRVLVVSR